MEVKDYLIVYGHNTVRGGSCYKESIINCNDLVKFSEVIKTIINNQNTNNWSSGIYIEIENERYVTHDRLNEMYPEISSDILHEFNKYLPDGITKIESIKVFLPPQFRLSLEDIA